MKPETTRHHALTHARTHVGPLSLLVDRVSHARTKIKRWLVPKNMRGCKRKEKKKKRWQTGTHIHPKVRKHVAHTHAGTRTHFPSGPISLADKAGRNKKGCLGRFVSCTGSTTYKRPWPTCDVYSPDILLPPHHPLDRKSVV